MKLQDLLIDRLRPGWRARADAQHPLWSLLERILVGLLTFLLWHFGERAAIRLHLSIRPEDRAAFAGPDSPVPTVAAIASICTFFLLLALVSMLVNAVEARIPFLRRLAEHGSDRVPGLTIREANRSLGRAALILAVPVVPLDLYALLSGWQGQ